MNPCRRSWADRRRNHLGTTDVRAFGRLDRAKTAVMRVVHVADFETSTVTRKTAGDEADRRRLCVISASGLIWSMNCESCRKYQNELITEEKWSGIDQIDRREDFVAMRTFIRSRMLQRHAHETCQRTG